MFDISSESKCKVFVYPDDLDEFLNNPNYKDIKKRIENEYKNNDLFLDCYKNTVSQFNEIKYFSKDDYLFGLFSTYHFEKLIKKRLENNNLFALPFLKKVEIQEGCKVLNDYLFYNSPNLEEVVLPNSLEEIGNEVFYGCPRLKKIYIPKNVKKIGNNIAGKCIFLNEIIVSSENKYYESRDCNLIIKKDDMKVILGCRNSKIPSDVLIIGYRSFYQQTLLKDLQIPANIKIENEAFFGCVNLKI